MFLNPFGYDIAFAYTMSLFDGSFIKADITFYLIAAMFFTVYLVSSKINPVKIANKFFNKLKIKLL